MRKREEPDFWEKVGREAGDLLEVAHCILLAVSLTAICVGGAILLYILVPAAYSWLTSHWPFVLAMATPLILIMICMANDWDERQS